MSRENPTNQQIVELLHRILAELEAVKATQRDLLADVDRISSAR